MILSYMMFIISYVIYLETEFENIYILWAIDEWILYVHIKS